MNYYDVNIWRGTHTIRVTFMYKDYIGHISYEIGGNCKGAKVLDFGFLENDTQEDIENYIENDCCFEYDEDEDVFRCKLHNSNGDILEYEDSPDCFSTIIVRIEITDYKKSKVCEL